METIFRSVDASGLSYWPCLINALQQIRHPDLWAREIVAHMYKLIYSINRFDHPCTHLWSRYERNLFNRIKMDLGNVNNSVYPNKYVYRLH